MRSLFCIILVLVLLTKVEAQFFEEISESAGINHAFEVDLATFGGGAAVLDIDNDGFEDVYITGGNASDVLYRNNGDGTFTNVFDQSGFDSTIPIHTQGAAAADINRDGYKDLLITTMYYKADRQLAPNLLFLNNGDGTFSDVTDQYGLTQFKSNSMSPSFGDINADGYPDLYIANYFSASPAGVGIFNDATITNSFAPAKDYFFINVSGQSFLDAAELYGIDHFGFGFEGTFTDWDNDRDADILLANDFGTKATPNVALRNDFPDKRLIDRANNLMLNFGMNAMGIAVGDFNFDGWMDYYVSNVSSSLFVINDQGDNFIQGANAGLSIPLINNLEYTGIPVSWGANFFDYDHDTDIDLFVNNGALNPTIRPNNNFFFELNSIGFFREVSTRVGLDDSRIGRGSVVFDYDNDGDLDLLVVNQKPRDPTTNLPEARCLLYRNDAANGNWLKIKLDGIRAEKDGLGSRIEVVVNGRLLIREIDGGSSHMSQNSTIAHFGLGDAEIVESVTVKWLGGNTQELTNVSANQTLTITEVNSSISSIDENKLFIFPSYFTDQMLIEYSLAEIQPIDISVYDASGRLITTLLKQDNPTQTGISQWRVQQPLIHGVYFVQLRTKDGVVTEKAVKL